MIPVSFSKMPPDSHIQPPPSLALFPCLRTPTKTLFFHRTLVLAITFFAYASFHTSRKPPSIVKSVLGPNIRDNTTDAEQLSDPTETGWAPFNGSDGAHRLGELDLAFLSAYSIGMYFAGHIGDRTDLRLLLTAGMLGSGVLTIAFGLGYWWDIHWFSYYLVVQIACGLFQSTGWPCVVAVVGNWFDGTKRGLIMGVWTSHASVGNILGSIIGSCVLVYGWGWSFVLPGLFVMVMGFVVYTFLIVSPEAVGLESISGNVELIGLVDGVKHGEAEELCLLPPTGLVSLEDSKDIESKSASSADAIGFIDAWRLPGVASFALCLFFSKLVAYTFLYWLPFYIRNTAVAGVHFSHKTAGMLSTIFDVGGVLGGVTAGYISDKIEAPAVTSLVFLSLSIFSLILYRIYGSLSLFVDVSLMLLSGLLVNGPYALITTAVSTDLGSNNEVGGNSRAMATVTAIIDGTGSIGAAVGPVLAGYMSSRGWNSVFGMLICSIFIAELFLIRVARSEIKEKKNQKRWIWQN